MIAAIVYPRIVRNNLALVPFSDLTYTIIAMMAHRCGETYDETVEILSGIKEVKCTNGLRSPVELTRVTGCFIVYWHGSVYVTSPASQWE